MTTYVEIGRRIRQARTELSLTQEDLGQLLSRQRSHAAISDIERGKTKLNLEDLSEFARVLGVSLDYFTTQELATRAGPPQRIARVRTSNMFEDLNRKLLLEGAVEIGIPERILNNKKLIETMCSLSLNIAIEDAEAVAEWIEQQETVLPIFDPTAYMKVAPNIPGHLAVARAFLTFRKALDHALTQ